MIECSHCGEPAEEFTEGVCSYCWRHNQIALDVQEDQQCLNDSNGDDDDER